MIAIIWIWILYVLSHDVSNALFNHVAPDCRKSIILGKAGSFSQKQVLACLMTQLLCQGHNSRMISIDQLIMVIGLSGVQFGL